MNKKSLFYALALLCIVAAVALSMICKNSSLLSELKDFWWVPLSLGGIAFLLASKRS
jgi:hypothetical protein